MYNNPEEYFIDAYGIEKLLGDRKPRKVIVSAKWNKRKDILDKLNDFEIITLPWRFRTEVMDNMTLEETSAVLSREAFDKNVFKKIKAKCYPKLPTNKMFDVLTKNGIEIKHTEDKVIISNIKYPQMFIALNKWKELLTKYSSGNKKYKYDSAYHHLDCRAFMPEYDITFDSVMSSMSDEVREYMTELVRLLSEYGINLNKADRIRSLYCDYKNEHLLYFAIDNTYPIIRTCMFKPGSAEAAAFRNEVEKLPNANEVKAFCLKGINRCRACGCHPVPPSQLGYWTEILGKKVKLCGGRRCFETDNITKESCEIMKTLLRINIKIIKGD
jgi:hypothetical protein